VSDPKGTAAIPDFQTWMAETFQRVESGQYIDVSRKYRLVINPIRYQVSLDADQARELAWQLRKAFCPCCGGTGFNEQTNSNCEACFMPF